MLHRERERRVDVRHVDAGRPARDRVAGDVGGDQAVPLQRVAELEPAERQLQLGVHHGSVLGPSITPRVVAPNTFS